MSESYVLDNQKPLHSNGTPDLMPCAASPSLPFENRQKYFLHDCEYVAPKKLGQKETEFLFAAGFKS